VTQCAPDLQRVIDQARRENLAAQKAQGHAAEQSDRVARIEWADDLIQHLPEWTRPLPEASLLDGSPEKFRVQAEHWCPSTGNLLLLGETGSYKTSAAAALVKRLVRLGIKRGGVDWRRVRTVAWYWAPTLEQARHDHPIGKDEAPKIVDASAASLLVIDDFGLGSSGKSTAIRDVLNARYQSGLPTVATSGCELEQLTAHYSSMAVRRLLESGGRSGAVVSVLPGAP